MNRYIGKTDNHGTYVADTYRNNEECFATRMATIGAAQREADAMNKLYAGVMDCRNSISSAVTKAKMNTAGNFTSSRIFFPRRRSNYVFVAGSTAGAGFASASVTAPTTCSAGPAVGVAVGADAAECAGAGVASGISLALPSSISFLPSVRSVENFSPIV